MSVLRRVLAVGVVGLVCVLCAPAGAFAAGPPTVEEESVLNVSDGSATLSARIDAHELESEYSFQYGPTAGYGQTAPVPSGHVAAEFAGGEVTAHVQGLSAGTVYHFRVIARNGSGAVEGADQAFQTQSSTLGPALPDGRQWEMVSPAQKHGALIYPLGNAPGTAIQAAANGDAFTFLASQPTEASPQGYALATQVLSTRGVGGWESQDISSQHAEATGPLVYNSEFQLFSSDLSQSVLQPYGSFEPALSPEASGQTVYLRSDYVNGNTGDRCTVSCYRPLVTGKPGYANVPPGTAFDKYRNEVESQLCNPVQKCGPQFLNATPDLSHIVLSAEVPLSPGLAEAGGEYLYEWSAGKLAPVSVSPNGELASEAQLGTSESLSSRHAISEDGSRVVWRQATLGRLYLLDGLYSRDISKGETIEIAPSGSESQFQIASSDGSRVFFTSTHQLTPDSGANPNLGNPLPDLYECEIVEAAGKLQCKLSDLTPLTPSGESADVVGRVLGASEDGSYVYFVANGVLAPGAVQGKCKQYFSSAEEAAEPCNLYVSHDGVTKLVAVLANRNINDWDQNTEGKLLHLTARVSPNGRWLTFMSSRELTGYDNRDAASGERDEEVYLYDAESGRLVCASCNPTGARPVGAVKETGLVDAVGNWRGKWLAANIPAWTDVGNVGGFIGHDIYQSRFLSDSGRLFFNSHDALVPQDVNGTWDVYEYEPPGVGGCTAASVTFSERSVGCVGLISSGISAEESAFLDASESGGDVFMLTAAKLSAQDTDTALDVYDAHECSAVSPCLPAAVTQPPPCGTGDSCKAAPTPQPAVFGAPASATFSGTGNVAAPAPVVTPVRRHTRPGPCGRARRVSRRRCVRSKSGKRKVGRARRANNGGGIGR